MLVLMGKSTSINLRISPDFRKELESLAAYRGLTLSGVAHSLLVRAVREEKEREPEAFDSLVTRTNAGGKMVGSKHDVRIMYQNEADILQIGDAEKPQRKKKAS